MHNHDHHIIIFIKSYEWISHIFQPRKTKKRVQPNIFIVYINYTLLCLTYCYIINNRLTSIVDCKVHTYRYGVVSID